jgi:DNA-binding response OmpR family regulator
MAIRTVLMVDDDPDIRLLVEMALSNAGMEVHSADCGTAAMRLATTLRPDVILLDATLPDMDGVAVYHALRLHEELVKTPVVFVTGRLLPEDRAHYRALGAAGLIAKPFDPFELPARIDAIVAGGDAEACGFEGR